MVSKIWLSDNLRVSKTYFLEVRGVLEHPEHPSGNATVLYARESARTPRTILQLYNCTWVHHELCSKLFPSTHKISREKLFGSYLHDLCSHAAQHYEIVCLRSVNAECQERLFGQAKRIALNTTNHHPNQVVTEVLLRLQMKQTEGYLLKSITDTQTKVQTAAKHVSPYTGTTIPKTFTHHHRASWQAHLERLSNYLLHGPEVWWTEDDTCYSFFDGDKDPDFHQQGPPLKHFQSTTSEMMSFEKANAWDTILENNIKVPAERVNVYDSLGDNVEIRYFTESTDREALPTDATSTTNSIHITTDINCMDKSGTNSVLHVLSEEIEKVTTVSTDEEHVQQSKSLKTSTAIAIAKVLGETDQVITYDKMRDLVRKQSKCPLTLKTEYNRLEAELQTKLLNLRSIKLQKLQQLENNQFSTSTATREQEYYSTEHRHITREFHYLQKLLRQMNIDI